MRCTMQAEKTSILSKDKLTDRVMEILMKWIMTGKLRMGDRLNTSDIADSLGVSRMPVREALLTLEEKGLAESIPYAGMRLIKLSEKDIYEIYLARQALEPLAAKHACMNITDKEIKRLMKIHEDYKKIVSKDCIDPSAVYSQNRLFHFTIYKISELPKINMMIEKLWDQLAFFKLIYGHKLLNENSTKMQLIQEHENYVQALVEHDPERIFRQMTETLQLRAENIPYSMEDYQHEVS